MAFGRLTMVGIISWLRPPLASWWKSGIRHLILGASIRRMPLPRLWTIGWEILLHHHVAEQRFVQAHLRLGIPRHLKYDFLSFFRNLFVGCSAARRSPSIDGCLASNGTF